MRQWSTASPAWWLARARRSAGVPTRQTDESGVTVGLGTPGSLTAAALTKDANTLCLNGRPPASDQAVRLRQPVRIANDANGLALSETTDGAGRAAPVVFAAILGTGCGAGITVACRVLTGPNQLAGEWAHNPLPCTRAVEPGSACYCGQTGCIETGLSGPVLVADHCAGTAWRSRACSLLKPPRPVMCCARPASVAGATGWHRR